MHTVATDVGNVSVSLQQRLILNKVLGNVEDDYGMLQDTIKFLNTHSRCQPAKCIICSSLLEFKALTNKIV